MVDEPEADEDGVDAELEDAVQPAGTPRWLPRTTSRPRSPSSDDRTSANRAWSTRCWGRIGRSCPTSPARLLRFHRHAARLGPQRDRAHRHGPGTRRRGKVASGPAAERYSTLRALRAIARADVAVLVVDAVDGLTAQDAHVAGYVVEEGKGLVVAVNKWDLLEEKTERTSTSTFHGFVSRHRSSSSRRRVDPHEDGPARQQGAGAGRRHRVQALLPRADRRAEPLLATAIERGAAGDEPRPAPEAVLRHPGGRRAADVRVLRIAPEVHFSYSRYLENKLREAIQIPGTPIKLVFRDRAESARPTPPQDESGRAPEAARKPSRSKPAAGRRQQGRR